MDPGRLPICWCTHQENVHKAGFCITCVKHYRRLMQPEHRFQPIRSLPPKRLHALFGPASPG